MNRKEIDALLETVRDLVHEQYFDGLAKFCEFITLELVRQKALDPIAFDAWLTYGLRDIDLASPGAKLLLKLREICQFGTDGKLPPPPIARPKPGHTSRSKTSGSSPQRRRRA